MYKEFASTYIWEVVFLAQNVNRNDAKFVMIFSSCVKKKCKKTCNSHLASKCSFRKFRREMKKKVEPTSRYSSLGN